MNENCMCAHCSCTDVRSSRTEAAPLCSISKHLYDSVRVQDHPSQQWRTCCFTDDSHKTSRDDFRLLSAISFMSAHTGSSGWAMEGSNSCFPSSPHSAEIRIHQRKRRITVTQVPLTPPSVQIYSITFESWTWEWNTTNKNHVSYKQRPDLMNKLFTVTAGKLRRRPVREAQREFNPNHFSSWFLAQIRLINKWIGSFLKKNVVNVRNIPKC